MAVSTVTHLDAEQQHDRELNEVATLGDIHFTY